MYDVSENIHKVTRKIEGDKMDNKEQLRDLILFFAELYKEPTDELYEMQSEEGFQKDFNQLMHQLNISLSLKTNLVKLSSFQEMKREYQELFLQTNTRCAPLYESFYKVWTSDETATLPFANSKRLFMGDSAWHIEYLLEELKVELSDHFHTMPDHLSIILELLAILIPNDLQMKVFITSHLDWLSELIKEVKQIKETSFYGTMTEMLKSILEDLMKKNKLEGIIC